MNGTFTLPNGIIIPVPLPPPQPTMAAFYYFLMAALICRSFFKKIDWEIQQTDGFKELGPIAQRFVKTCLDFLHHWWMGYGVMVFTAEIAAAVRLTEIEVYWIGLAVLVDDLPDMPERLRKLFEGFTIFERKEG